MQTLCGQGDVVLMAIKHIINTDKNLMLKTLCGLHGPTVYNPTESDCQDCLKRFQQMYPGSYEAWLKRKGPANADSNNTDD